MNKITLTVLFFVHVVIISVAQPGTSYTIKTGASFSLTSDASPLNDCISGACPQCTSAGGKYMQRGFQSPAGAYTWPALTPNGGVGNTVTVSIAPGVAGSVQIWKYVRRDVDFYNNGTGCVTAGAQIWGALFNITITTVADLAATANLPATMCQGQAAINLYSYVNRSSNVTFKIGTTTISNTFDPASYAVGTYSITASYSFANGTTTITVGTITVYSVITVQGQPTNAIQCPTGAVDFSASGAGSGLSYLWQESSNGGGSWMSLANAGVYSGVNTGTLTISNISGKNGNLYRLQMAGNCNTIYSNQASITHHGQIPVTNSPVSQIVCPTSTATFIVAGTPRSGSLTYQWQHFDGSSWVDLAEQAAQIGTQTPSFTYGPGGITKQFRCRLRDDCGVINENYSAAATYSVYGGVSVISNPVNKSVCPGGSTTFTASGTAQNGIISYQWQESKDSGGTWANCSDGTSPYGLFSGTTSSTLSIGSITSVANGFRYRCRLQDACGSATQVVTTGGILGVFGQVAITGSPSDQTVCPSSGAIYTASGTGTNGSVSYQWQVSTNSGSTYSNLSDGAGYSGSTTSTLSLTNITSAWATNFSLLRYRCYISDACGSSTASVTTGARLLLYGQVAVTTQPVDRTICPGSNTTFSIVASAQNGPLSYLWEVSTNGGSVWSTITNGGIYSGASTPTLTLLAATTMHDGYRYRVRVSDACGSVTSNVSSVATLQMYEPVSVQVNPPNRTICPSANTTFIISATGTNGALSYQWQVSTNGGTSYSNVTNAGVYSGSTTSVLTLSGATVSMNNYRYRAVVADACGAVNQVTSTAGVLSFYSNVSISTPPTNQTGCVGGDVAFSVAATGSGIVYQWQESINSGITYTDLTNTGIYSGATTTMLTLSGVTAAFSTRRYRAVVSGTCNEINSDAAVLTIIVPPSITTDPSSNVVCQLTGASFSVGAAGSSLTYQWQYSNSGGTGTFSNIAGATASSYSITSSTAANAGYYRAVINNGCAGGGTASGSAQLTVNPLTTFTINPGNASVCPGGSTSFSGNATGTGTISYQWQVSSNGGSSFADLSNGGFYSGVTASTLSISSANASISTNEYRVRAIGGCGSAVLSSKGVLTVNPIPVKPTATDPSRCGDGLLSATAASASPSPVFKWYANENDVVSVFNGATYQITNLTLTTNYYVTVTSLNCESSKEEVVFTRHAPQNVPLGNPLSLCMGQGLYNLENDIADGTAKGSNFTWTANSTNYTSKNFDPGVGAGNYVVSYDPPSGAKAVPYCYMATNRNITVISSAGEGGISFNSSLVSNGHTVNMCVGDTPIDIATFPSIPSGTWSTVSGTGLSFSGNAVVFTPNQNSYTAVLANVFRYTVQVNGCTAIKDLEVYVKDNQNPPIVTGITGVVCPGRLLNLASSVSTPGTFQYEWYKSGETTPFSNGNNVSYTVVAPETLQVRSINSPFGCRSEATLVTIATPFSSGTIEVSKSSVPSGDYVTFRTDASEVGNSFQWNFGDGATSTEKGPTHYYYKIGEFIVTLSIQSSLGCAQTVSYEKITVTGDPIEIITGVENQGSQEIQVYPNPVTTEIRIESETPITDYTLYDLAGRNVGARRSGDDKSFSISMAGLKAGIYILHLGTRDLIKKIKVVKKE